MIWLIVNQAPIILVFLTLGIVNFNKSIELWFRNLYESYIPINTNPITSCLIFILALLLTDFAKYLAHRIYHSNEFMWDLHEFHHSPTEMTILSRLREVPLGRLIVAPLLMPLTVLNGLLIYEFLSRGFSAPLYIYIFDGMMQVFIGHFAHSSTKVVFPKIFSYFYMSPSLHWLHHSSNPEHYDRNFGMKYPYWDKIFGTYLDHSHVKDIKGYGVSNTQYNKYNPFYVYVILPVRKLINRSKITLIEKY